MNVFEQEWMMNTGASERGERQPRREIRRQEMPEDFTTRSHSYIFELLAMLTIDLYYSSPDKTGNRNHSCVCYINTARNLLQVGLRQTRSRQLNPGTSDNISFSFSFVRKETVRDGKRRKETERDGDGKRRKETERDGKRRKEMERDGKRPKDGKRDRNRRKNTAKDEKRRKESETERDGSDDKRPKETERHGMRRKETRRKETERDRKRRKETERDG